MINKILKACEEVKDGRTIIKPMLKVTEEVGELSTEVSVDLNLLPKSKGSEDGIIGEACDVIIATVDVIYQSNPSITLQDLTTIVESKLKKWQQSIKTN